MNVRCQHCGLDLQAPADSEGKALACPGCGGRFLCQLPRAVVLSPAPVAAPAVAALADTQPCLASTIALSPAPAPAARSLPFLDERLRPTPADANLADLARQTAVDEQAAPGQPDFQTLDDLANDSTPWQVLEQASTLAPASFAEPAEEVTASSHPWYVIISGVPVAAMTFAQLRRKALQGTIRPRDKLYYAPKNAHLRAIDVPGLFPAAVLLTPSPLQKLFRRKGPEQTPVIPQVPQASPPMDLPDDAPVEANADLAALQRAVEQGRS